MAKKVLVTGAGGFIGGFIIEEALRRNYEVWAAVRATTSRKYLSDPRINLIELDFSNPDKLKAAISQEIKSSGKWDYVVHNLGATKCLDPEDFEKINYGYLRRLVDTLIALDAVPDGFLMMSSMGVLGMGDETGKKPFTAATAPNPNTKYGKSKLKAERYMESIPGFPYLAFRPTGVYGPRERDYYLMMKTIDSGFDFSVGFQPQTLTFIYVKDLATAVFDALESGKRRKPYLLSDGKSYSQKDFRDIVKTELGKRLVVPVTAPLWLLKTICLIAEKTAALAKKASTLNRDKYVIMKQRNWTCDISEARNDFGFNPRYDLHDGLKEAIAWYKSNNWLK